MGVCGYGAHDMYGEYILLDCIAPRLYLVARMVMALSDPATAR